MEASKADLEWSARIDRTLKEYPEVQEYLDGIRGNTEALATRLEAVRDLHEPIRIYTECDHDNCTAEHIEVLDYPACENSLEGYACGACCFGNSDYMQEWCPHDLNHTGLDADHACPTRAATYDP